MNEGFRICTECKRELPLTEFYIQSTERSTWKRRCKKCYCRFEMEKRQKNPEKSSFGRVQHRSRKIDVAFTLTFEFFKTLLLKPCHYCGKIWNGQEDKNSGWLDRIDNQKGYTLENVLPCCEFCNYLRGDRLTVEETLVAMKAIISYRHRN